MDVFAHPSFDDHEGVHFISDPTVGLQAIVAVHSTARGPAAGGTRMWRYADQAAALTDVLNLSRAMSYKNAMADLPLGGGKAVILRPSQKAEAGIDREALFEAYGARLDGLGGRYITAEDVGVTPSDMRAIARRTRYVAGLPEGEAASGDPSPITARGVYLGMRAAVRHRLQREDLSDLRVAVQGVGHVGGYLCTLLAEAGARLVICDVNDALVRQVGQDVGATIVEPEAIYQQDVEVFAPCALGGAINVDTIALLRCAVVAGGANNQLATPFMAAALAERDILYAPDYVINAGGIINVAAEVSGAYNPDWVDAKLLGLVETLEAVFAEAARTGLTTDAVAEGMARTRIAAAKVPSVETV